MESGWNAGMGSGDADGGHSIQGSSKGTVRVSERPMAQKIRVGRLGDAEADSGEQVKSFTQAAGGGEYRILNMARGDGSGEVENEEQTEAKTKDQQRSVVQEVHQHLPQLAAEGVRKVNAKNLMAMLEQQGRRCALSGRLLTPDNVVIDHINPFSESDEHTMDNVHLVVEEVNRAKGTMSTGDFIRLCDDVAKTHPISTQSQ